MLFEERMRELRSFLGSWTREKQTTGLRWQQSSADIFFGKKVISQFKGSDFNVDQTLDAISAHAASDATFREWISEMPFERLQEIIKFQFSFPR
ncbi:MAG: hypothetical protein WCK46_01075 [Candidatus Adlerbacteria bacterium]